MGVGVGEVEVNFCPWLCEAFRIYERLKNIPKCRKYDGFVCFARSAINITGRRASNTPSCTRDPYLDSDFGNFMFCWVVWVWPQPGPPNRAHIPHNELNLAANVSPQFTHPTCTVFRWNCHFFEGGALGGDGGHNGPARINWRRKASVYLLVLR